MVPVVARFLVSTFLVLSAGAAFAEPPGPPVNVTATVNANQTLTVRWTPPLTGSPPTDYVVEMSIYPQPEYFFGAFQWRVPGNVTTYTTEWLRERTYYVRVRARNADGNALSNIVAATMPCLLAVGADDLSWRALGGSQVRLVWTWEPSYVDIFLAESWHPAWVVEVGTAPGLTDAFVGRGAENRSATLTVPPGNYYARVRATCHGEAAGPLSPEIAISSSAGSGPSPVVISEFADGDAGDPRAQFVEIRNISNAPVAIGGWKILVAAYRVSRAATVQPGTTLQPGCTYLLGPAGGIAGVPVDAALAGRPSDAALVTETGRIADGVASVALSPLGEGTPLTPLPPGSNASYARRGAQDTNDNAADFVFVSSPTPQNSASPCDAEPGPPLALASSVTGQTVNLWWDAPLSGRAPTTYRIEAGSVPGAADLAIFDLPASTRAVAFMSIPNGTYFVRVRAYDGSGISAPSNEITVVVCGAGCTEPPGAVTSLAFQVSGSTVLLTWRAPTSGPPPTQYIVEAGSAAGATDLARFATGSTTEFVVVSAVPPGSYFVRIRATNGAAVGPPSNEVTITVR